MGGLIKDDDMTNLIQCVTCCGRKKYSPLGGIEKDCPSCKGIGFISSTINHDTIEVSTAVPDIIPIEPVSNRSIESLKDKLQGSRRNSKSDSKK